MKCQNLCYKNDEKKKKKKKKKYQVCSVTFSVILGAANKIKALRVLVGRLSLGVGRENGPERGLKTILFNP